MSDRLNAAIDEILREGYAPPYDFTNWQKVWNRLLWALMKDTNIQIIETEMFDELRELTGGNARMAGAFFYNYNIEKKPRSTYIPIIKEKDQVLLALTKDKYGSYLEFSNGSRVFRLGKTYLQKRYRRTMYSDTETYIDYYNEFEGGNAGRVRTIKPYQRIRNKHNKNSSSNSKYTFYLDEDALPKLIGKEYFDRSILDGSETFQVRRRIGLRMITYYIEHSKGLQKMMYGTSPRIFICIGYKAGKMMDQILCINKMFNSDDVYKEIKKYQYITTCNDLYFCHDEHYKTEVYKKITGFNIQYIPKNYILCLKGSKDQTIEEIDSATNIKNLLDVADHLLYELQHFYIDFSNLNKSEAYKRYEKSKLDPRLLHAMQIGAIFLVKGLVKAAIKQIGGDINIDGDFDFDGGFDGDFDNNLVVDGDFDFDGDVGCDFDINGDDALWFASINDFDGLSFQGKHFDNFEDLRRTISVPVLGGGGNEKLHLYKKLGSNAYYVSDGSCLPVSISGHSWISVGSHSFNVSDIKTKL